MSRPVKNISPELGDAVKFDSLEEMYEAVKTLDYLPEEGLREGRDFEYIMLMEPNTGSVSSIDDWKNTFKNMTEEERLTSWGGPRFEDARLIEVISDGKGGWIEA